MDKNYILPASILIAAVLISGSIFYSLQSKNDGAPVPDNSEV